MTFLDFSLHEYHNITIGLFTSLEALLFDHLGVIDEANELPFAQVNYSLRHVISHVYYSNLFVPRSESLVCEKRIIDHP